MLVACGAVHSPAVLLRSGIGPAADLARLGTEVRISPFKQRPSANIRTLTTQVRG